MIEVSGIGLGCNNFGRGLDRQESAAVVHAALDAGVTFFDTARHYGDGLSESYLGAALGTRRREVVIATKFGRIPRLPDAPGAGRADVRASLTTSLRELGTDYIDLFQLHFPDPEVPIAETLGALQELVEEGKARHVGCANFDTRQLREALEVSTPWAGFVSNQVQYSMVHRAPEENGLAELCVQSGVALLPYYPLASGLLTGKTRRGAEPQGRLRMERYQRFLTDRNFAIAEAVEEFARQRDLAPAQVALRWLLTRPAVPAVTPGATRPEQVAANVAALDWTPTAADLAELATIVDADVTAPRASPPRATRGRPR